MPTGISRLIEIIEENEVEGQVAGVLLKEAKQELDEALGVVSYNGDDVSIHIMELEGGHIALRFSNELPAGAFISSGILQSLDEGKTPIEAIEENDIF